MIILDTNVVSEVMSRKPAAVLVDWFDSQVPATLFLSTITLAEITFGIRILPEGRRRAELSDALGRVLRLFEDRILPFDTRSAEVFGDLAARAQAAGRGFPVPDGYIAAIAAARGFSVATRDDSAFTAAGLTVINPWSSR